MEKGIKNIIKGSLTIAEEDIVFQECSIKLLSDIILLNKDLFFKPFSLLIENPTKENLLPLLDLAESHIEYIKKNKTCFSSTSNILFESSKHTLKMELKKVKDNLIQLDVKLLVERFYRPFFENTLLVDATE